MPPLRDARELLRYKAILEESRRFGGYIQWKRQAAETVREQLSNYTQRAIEQLIYEHREEVDQTPEHRTEYRDFYRYHYDFRIPINGQIVYIETIFEPGATDDDSTIEVVRIKPANPDEPWNTTTT